MDRAAAFRIGVLHGYLFALKDLEPTTMADAHTRVQHAIMHRWVWRTLKDWATAEGRGLRLPPRPLPRGGGLYVPDRRDVTAPTTF